MANLIVLDTCIYQELGYKFYEATDYRNLFAFATATDGEVLLSTIVAAEFTAHYQNDLLKKSHQYQQSVAALQRDSLFPAGGFEFPDISDAVKASTEAFSRKLKEDPKHQLRVTILPETQMNGLELTGFILASKQAGIANVQVRDYLLWDAILTYAKKYGADEQFKMGRRTITHKKSLITFITKDNGFEKNPLFQALKERYGVDNLEIKSSIPQYLHHKGHNQSFLTPAALLKKINVDRIMKDLVKDLPALITYIDPAYNEGWEKTTVRQAEIRQIELLEYYSYQDTEDQQFKYVAHLKVQLYISYDTSVKPLKPAEANSYLETFDAAGRPVFDSPVLYIYGGLLNIKRESLSSLRLIDMLPWLYIS